MKVFWHTKTLFLQNGKYYKWSYKHTHCIECGNCNHKHKGNGLCTSCFDKNRANKPNRLISRKKACKKFYEENYEPVIERKKKPKIFTGDVERVYKRKWYDDNRPAMKLKAKIKRRKQKWLPCIVIMIKWKTKYLPFETLEKPAVTTDKWFSQWQKNMKDYDILIAYYNKNGKF